MAIYYCHVAKISRSDGRTATAAAAYRSGTKIVDHHIGETFDYRRKQGVEYSQIILPQPAESFFNQTHTNTPNKDQSQRELLWNLAEETETRKNSVVAREVRVALPNELTKDQRKSLTEQFSKELLSRYQVGIDINIHEPHKQGDHRNYHAHILITTRRFTKDGLGKKKRELDDLKTGREEIRWIRKTWADITNDHLNEQNIEARIDHRSYEEQGINKIPGINMGVAATAMERRGIRTEKGDINREIAEQNKIIEEIIKEQAEITAKIEAEQAKLKTDPKHQQMNRQMDQPNNEQENKKETTENDLKTIDNEPRKNTPQQPPKEPEETLTKLETQFKQAVLEKQNSLETKAKNIQIKLTQKAGEVEKRLSKISINEPQKPKGIFSIFHKKTYEKDYEVWQTRQKAVQSRKDDLSKKYYRVYSYVDEYKSYQRKTRIEKKSHQLAKKKHPELCNQIEQKTKMHKKDLETLKETEFYKNLGDVRIYESAGHHNEGKIIKMTDCYVIQEVSQKTLIAHRIDIFKKDELPKIGENYKIRGNQNKGVEIKRVKMYEMEKENEIEL